MTWRARLISIENNRGNKNEILLTEEQIKESQEQQAREQNAYGIIAQDINATLDNQEIFNLLNVSNDNDVINHIRKIVDILKECAEKGNGNAKLNVTSALTKMRESLSVDGKLNNEISGMIKKYENNR